MWKNIVQRGRPQMTIWRMRIACWITKAANTHTLRLCNTHCLSTATVVVRKRLHVTLYVRGVSGKLRYITCRPVGKFFMLIVAALPKTLILYLWAVLVWQWQNRLCLRRVWNGSADPKSRQMWDFESSITSFPKCLKATIHEAVTEKLGYRKLCAR